MPKLSVRKTNCSSLIKGCVIFHVIHVSHIYTLQVFMQFHILHAKLLINNHVWLNFEKYEYWCKAKEALEKFYTSNFLLFYFITF